MSKFLRIIIAASAVCILYFAVSAAEFPDIIFTAAINKASGTSFTLDYSVNISGINPSDYMDEAIYYPDEYLTAESYITSGVITEKDFLNSERNIDLNGDGDTDDTLSISSKGGNFTLAGRKISPLFKKRNSALLLLPFDENKKENLIRVKPDSPAFSIHSIDVSAGRITAGAGRDGAGVAFKKYPNSIIVIEIIPASADAVKTGVIINKETAADGITNELNLSSDGSPLNRYTAIVPVPMNGRSVRGNVNIEKIDHPFTARIRYCFAVSSRVIMVSEKIIKSVNMQK